MPIRPSSSLSVVVVVNFSLEILISQKLPDNFLAPPAERQRSFSNADSCVVRRRRLSSSVVVVNFSLKMLISQKLSDNFFSFLVYSFIRKVPMFCINIDLIESS